jgi:hypothetical protein
MLVEEDGAKFTIVNIVTWPSSPWLDLDSSLVVGWCSHSVLSVAVDALCGGQR